MFRGAANFFSSERFGARNHFLVIIFVFHVLLAGGARETTAAQPKSTPADLTDALVKLHGQYGKAQESHKSSIVTKMQSVALARRQAMLARIAENPGAVIKAALPDALGRRFPMAVRALLEEDAELDGDLEILHEDRPRGSRFHYALRSQGDNYTLHFRKDPPSHLKSGTRVRVRGIKVERALALESGSESVFPLAAATPNTFGEQRAIVILINFKDKPAQPYTASEAQNLVFNTVNNFLLENSYQQTFLSGDVKGWYTIDMNSPVSNCDYSQISSKADAAATAAGVPLALYNRKIYAFPKATGCGWWGLGTVGGNPSRAWINGDLKLRVVAHELGHNLGLYHSHSLDCGKVALGHVCTVSDYGDSMDTMGSASFHFNAFQKERLGWLAQNASPPITLAQATGSYLIYPYETIGNEPKSLKIFRSNNPSNGRPSYFYAECRRAIGVDAGVSSYPNVLGGFLLHMGEEHTGNSSYLLDMTPETSTWADPALVVGQSFTDPVAGVTITPEAPCTDGLNGSIAVTFGVGACARSAPEVTLGSSKNSWTVAGKSVSYPVTVVNHDENCGAADFTLTPLLPQGWTATLKSPVLSIDSGASKTVTLILKLPMDVADGLHNFDVTATHNTDPALADTSSGSIVVVSSLAVNASMDAAVFGAPGIALATVTVNLNGAPVAKARVRITITRPDGRLRKAVARTDRDGVAKFKYRLRRRNPVGAYAISATARASGLEGNANMNFLLQ
jgi:hypothetical protein